MLTHDRAHLTPAGSVTIGLPQERLHLFGADGERIEQEPPAQVAAK